jgi:hypothetical protein
VVSGPRTLRAAREPLAEVAVHQALRPRGDGGFPSIPHDPPEPRASLLMVAPGEGTSMNSGQEGVTVTVTVDVTFRSIPVVARPRVLPVLVDGAPTDIPQQGTTASGAVRYEGPVHLAAGTISCTRASP